MQTLALSNGDLVLSGSSYALATGSQRVVQDLRCALAEPMGNDRFHPRWGSLLQTYVGQPITPETVLYVQAEANRVVQNYMAVQSDNIATDARNGVPSRYATDDIIDQIASIAVTGDGYDTLTVSVSLTLLDGSSLGVSAAVSLT